MSAAKVIKGFDYDTNLPVEHSTSEWRDLIKEMEARGGRTVRHPVGRRRFVGDNDLLLMERGTIIAEVYDRD